MKKLDDGPFFAKFMKNAMRRIPALRQAMAGADSEIIGHLPEGADLAHVVHRLTVTVEGTKVSKLDVASLKRTESGWAMLLSGEIDGFANALKRKYKKGE